MRLERRWLERLYRRLHAAWGPQRWWPADTPFEVMVGAVLTQNTAWRNVERAIARLRDAHALDPQVLAMLPPARVAGLIRPAGYFNVKAARLQALVRWYLDAGGHAALARRHTPRLREGLLAVHGVGPETADDILLYAFRRPVFVIDAYTRRLVGRLRDVPATGPYEAWRQAFERALPPRAALFGELHALIVAHGKAVCRPRPRCAECALRRGCRGRFVALPTGGR